MEIFGLTIGFVFVLVGFSIFFSGLLSGYSDIHVIFLGIILMVGGLLFFIETIKMMDRDFESTYVVYRAYDDEKFSKDEFDAFKSFESQFDKGYLLDVLENFEEFPANSEARKGYEDIVNSIIKYSDGSESKLAFKRYVVERELSILENAWDDKKFDDREMELFQFVEDVTGDTVIDRVNSFVDKSELKTAQGAYDGLIDGISKEFGGREVSETETKDESSSGGMFKLSN